MQKITEIVVGYLLESLQISQTKEKGELFKVLFKPKTHFHILEFFSRLRIT